MRKKIVLGVILGVVTGSILTGSLMALFSSDEVDGNNSSLANNEVVDSTEIDSRSILNFIESIEGVEVNNIQVISDPIGFKGKVFVPDYAVVNGVNYFLEETNNDKMKNLKIESEENYISVTVDYRVIGNIDTPIELKINPQLNGNKDLIITVQEVRFLDIKIADWIVDIALGSFIEDWFSNIEEYDIDFNDGDITIYKENFKGIELTDIFLDEGLNIEVIIKLENIL